MDAHPFLKYSDVCYCLYPWYRDKENCRLQLEGSISLVETVSHEKIVWSFQRGNKLLKIQVPQLNSTSITNRDKLIVKRYNQTKLKTVYYYNLLPLGHANLNSIYYTKPQYRTPYVLSTWPYLKNSPGVLQSTCIYRSSQLFKKSH